MIRPAKKFPKLLPIFAISFLCASFYFADNNPNATNGSRDIVLQFITYNGYGNNLYIDNVLTGTQRNDDVAVTSILNIPYDTTYSILTSGIDTISPQVTVSNIGQNSIGGTIKISLSIEPGGYFDTTSIAGLSFGQSTVVTLPTFVYTVGTGYYLKAYASYETDSNRVNDTLFQYSIVLPGYKRNVLYEEFTSDSSPACANNNSFLNEFVNDNIDTVTAIKYHVGLLGQDTFYAQNPLQSDARQRYYYISAVPTTIVDGKLYVSIPYGDSVNLYRPYMSRLSKGTPLEMSVTDERIGGDSIKTTINIDIISAMPQGSYKLRINAVERYIIDSSQAYFGEYEFYDVFRAAYPDTNGIPINPSPGNYQYQYTYYRPPGWVDSMIYTAAFVQDDDTREVYNCAKGRNIVMQSTRKFKGDLSGKADMLDVKYQFRNFGNDFFSDSIQTALNVELFEAYFPPLGWRVFNRDGAITFDKFTGANGPTISGSSAVQMAFYDYNIIGQKDSMYSKVYTNLLSSDTLRFDYAYAQFNSTNIDSLIVKVSTDGGLTFPREVFRRGGLQLATAPQTSSYFIPMNNTQWRTVKFSLDTIVSIFSPDINLPQGLVLNQNYPNPFNPKTMISYEVPAFENSAAVNVSLIVYDITGKEIARLVNQKQHSGVFQIEFDSRTARNGAEISSGVYFYKLIVNEYSAVKKMLLLK